MLVKILKDDNVAALSKDDYRIESLPCRKNGPKLMMCIRPPLHLKYMLVISVYAVLIMDNY